MRIAAVVAADVSAKQCHVRIAAVHFAFVGDQAEFSVLGFDQRLAYTMHVALMLHAVADQLRHREHFHFVGAAEFDQVGHAGHGAVVFHDFADDAGGNHAGQPRQIDGGFGLAGADEDSSFAGSQRKHVAGPRQIGGSGCGVDGYFDGVGAIVGGDSGGHALARVDGFAESGAVLRGVFAGHGTDAQMVETLFGHG